MTDPRVAKMAEVIAKYSIGLKPSDRLLVVTEARGMPLCREVFRQALLLNAHPYVRTTWAELDELLLRSGSDEQISYVHELERAEVEQFDARLVIRAEENLRTLSSVDPKLLARQRASRRKILERVLERKAAGELRTCLTRFPTEAAAQEAGMSLSEYEDFVFGACMLDRPNPIQAWQELSREQERHVNMLNKVDQLEIEAADTSLVLSVSGRKWINSDGRANFPSGEVFTGPIEESAEGHIRFDLPSFYGGRKVEGITIEFHAGRVVRASADKGGELLLGLLDTDDGARFLGEVAFGLNYGIVRSTGDILFDEKIGGTVHLALGAGYPETGSRNRSGIHWDMIKDMRHGGRVLGDGRWIFENGRFVS